MRGNRNIAGDSEDPKHGDGVLGAWRARGSALLREAREVLTRPEAKWALTGLVTVVGVGVVAGLGPSVFRSIGMSTSGVNALIETPLAGRSMRSYSEWNKVSAYVKSNGVQVASHLRRTR